MAIQRVDVPISQTSTVVAGGLLAALTGFVVANRLMEIRRPITRENIVLDSLAVGALAAGALFLIRSGQKIVLENQP